MPVHFRIIGDVHGERPCYRTLIKDATYTLQIGDFDYEYDWLVKEGVSEKFHRFLGGNHDNYDNAPLSRHYLGDFGVHTIPDFGDIFFVRGAWSIDWRARRTHNQYDRGRILPKNYWPDQEELDLPTAQKALELYKEVRPNFVVAHEAPLFVVPYVTNPEFAFNLGYSNQVIKTRTNQLLQAMIEAHRPKTFVFGHYHRTWSETLEGTCFICVNICQTLDLAKNGEIS